MTDKQRIMKVVDTLNDRVLLDLALRLDAVSLWEIKQYIGLRLGAHIKAALIDMNVIKG